MKLKLFFACIIFLVFSGLSHAQQTKTISGIITDANQVPLPGAEVKVDGKEIYDVTDFDGNFTLENVEVGDVFRVTFLGFAPQEVEVTENSNYSVILQEDAGQLDEVVVVGYGSQSRADITGAIASVKSEDIVKQPALNAAQAVQGKVAGVNIIANDAPGSTPTVLVRGLGTAEGGRDPFYVVDGQPVQDIQNISPNDIESIEFLKGASYANIYGIRAANGVILITTKRGKGKPTFSFDTYYGIRTVQNQVEMANGSQYVDYFNEESAASGGYQLQQNQPFETDWYDELLQTGTISNNSFSVSGAGENIDYFLSYNFYDEEGILEENNYSRGTIRNNNTFHLFDDRFRIIQNLNISYTNESPKPFGSFSNAYRQSPLVPVFYPNGRFGQSYVNQTTGIVNYIGGEGESIGRLNPHGNPVSDVFFADEDINTTTLQGQITAELDLTDYLTFTTRFGATQFYFKRYAYTPTRERWLNADPRRTLEQFQQGRVDADGDGSISTEFANNSYTVRNENYFRWNIEGFLTFEKTFGKHNLDATVGISRENFGGREFLEGQAYDVFEERRFREISRRTANFFDNTVTQEFNQSTNLQSYFARAEYNFDKKYYLRAVVRRDGSSNFITGDNYFATFPAFSVGWTLTNEEFLNDSEVLNYFKIFAGWGEIGNANVPINIQQVNSGDGSRNTNYVFGPTQSLILGAAFGSPVETLEWETTQEWEVGFDYGLFDRKLTGTAAYYQRTNTNAIIQVTPLLNSAAEGNFLAQAAEVVNEGFEFLANWSDDINDDFSYNIGVNFSTNENTVQNVREAFDGQTGGSLGNGQITKRLKDGEPLFAWWMYEADGVWQTQQEIDNNPSVGNAAPGHLRYVDQNDDGVIDDRDKKYFGSYIPTYNYGVRFGINYKNIDLSVDGYGVGGNKVYNGLKNTRLGGENVTLETFNNRWTGPGSTNSAPGADRDAIASSYYLEDGDFFRINNMTVGYTLEDISLVKRARIYFTLQNPFMFTNYSGFTPELNQNGNPKQTTGIELSAYPTTRTFLIGANLQL